MKMHAYVAGIGMTRFGNHLTVKLKDLAAEAIREALMDSGLDARDIQAASRTPAPPHRRPSTRQLP